MTIDNVVNDLQIALSDAREVNAVTTITNVINDLEIALADAQSLVSALPVWRQGRAIGVWATIPGSSMKNMVPQPPGATIDAWNGLAAVSDATRAMWVSAANGGHTDSSDNGVYAIDFLQGSPKWTTLHAPTPLAQRPTQSQAGAGMPAVPYDSDGTPNSCHSYFGLQFCPQRNLVIRPFGSALWYAAQSSPKMDGFNLATSEWEPAGTFQDSIYFGGVFSVCTDQRTGDIYVGTVNYQIAKWTQTTGSWGTVPLASSFGVPGYHGTIIDGKRNRLVRSYYGGSLASLPCLDLTTFSVTLGHTGITDTPVGEGRIIHDTDADLYYVTDSVGVWSIDPVTFTATTVAPLPVKAVNGVQSRFSYFPLLKGIVYYPNFTSDIYFYPTR